MIPAHMYSYVSASIQNAAQIGRSTFTQTVVGADAGSGLFCSRVHSRKCHKLLWFAETRKVPNFRKDYNGGILSNPWNACEQTHGISENRVTFGKQEDLMFDLVRSMLQREQHVCVKRNQHRKRIPMDADLFCGTGNGI